VQQLAEGRDTPHAVPATTGIDAPSPGELTYILNWEKYSRNIYDKDGAKNGNCTIGYGHLLHTGPCTKADYSKYADGWSQEKAYQQFLTDVQMKGTDCVNRYVEVPLTQDQFDALVDFGFNAGCDSLNPKVHTLVQVLNKAQYDKVPDELRQWVHDSDGNRVKGLVRRRGDDARKFGGQSAGTPPSLATCAADNVAVPPTAGCDRVKVTIVPNLYPGDAEGGLGVGVGSASFTPGARKFDCLNPSDAPCVAYEDFPANTKVTVTATPGSEAPDDSAPPDSAFYNFYGPCTASGDACTLTASSNNMAVEVNFIPAVVTLTLDASPRANSEMSANGDTPVAGTDPLSPVYCGAPGDAMGLPCSMLVRVHGEVTVQADDEGHSQTPTFSSNCPAREAAPDYCDITLTSDQTVTATFSGS
jgi:lysozyme